MIAFHRRFCISAGRWSAIAVALLCLAPSTPLAQAGFLVGTVQSPKDNMPVVLGIIDDYNANNAPDLPTDFELFKKTDDDSAFVFNLANGFAFYEDALLTVPIFTEAELTALPEAYFTYSGPENLLYYSIKAGPNVSLYTFMAGANLLDIPDAGNDISHVSFWNGNSGPIHIPEPTTAALVGCGLLGVLLTRRFRRLG